MANTIKMSRSESGPRPLNEMQFPQSQTHWSHDEFNLNWSSLVSAHVNFSLTPCPSESPIWNTHWIRILIAWMSKRIAHLCARYAPSECNNGKRRVRCSLFPVCLFVCEASNWTLGKCYWNGVKSQIESNIRAVFNWFEYNSSRRRQKLEPSVIHLHKAAYSGWWHRCWLIFCLVHLTPSAIALFNLIREEKNGAHVVLHTFRDNYPIYNKIIILFLSVELNGVDQTRPSTWLCATENNGPTTISEWKSLAYNDNDPAFNACTANRNR